MKNKNHRVLIIIMFGSLVDYLDNQQFLLDNSEIKIYTPTKALKYKIYACVVYDDRLIPASFDFNSTFGRQAFIDSINAASADSRSVYNPNVKISADDHLITLSTCRFPTVVQLKQSCSYRNTSLRQRKAAQAISLYNSILLS